MNGFMFFWLSVAFTFLLLEMGHPGLFFFLSFCFAALGSAKVAYFGFSLVSQLMVFVIGFFAAFGLLRMYVRRIAHHHVPRTNMYALEGKKGLVIATIIPNFAGQVKVNGEIWMAKSLDNELLPEGSMVQVVRVQGAHLVVQSIAE